MDSPSEYPPFVLGKPRFDQATFTGRLRHFLDVIDPRTLLTSKTQLEASIKLLEDYKEGTSLNSVTNAELWKAQKIKQAIIHPDTGEKIMMPFRMSGFVPFGSPIVVGLLLPNPTLLQTVFWQWLNQSHNACVNYSNRNASKETHFSQFLIGYTGAVTSAVAIAVVLSMLIKRANKFSPATKMLIQKFVPFPAVATASACNVILMRNSELSSGIDVFDKDKKVVGTSQLAAKKALQATAVTRVCLSAPILLLPPIAMTLLEKTRFLKKYPKMHLPCNAVACTAAFGLALPIAIALFPQISQVKTIELEKQIQESTCEPCLYYNKGL